MRFYGALGLEPRGRLNFESAYNLYMGLPGDGDVLELTVNRGQEEPYDLGTGYNHMAVHRRRHRRSAGRAGSRSASSPRSPRTTPAGATSCR